MSGDGNFVGKDGAEVLCVILERYIEESAEDRVANKLTDHIYTFLEFTEDYMQTLRDEILCLIFKLAARDDAETSRVQAIIDKTEHDANNTNLIIEKVYKNPTYTKFSKKDVDGNPKTRRCLRKEIFEHVRFTLDPSTLLRSDPLGIVRKSTVQSPGQRNSRGNSQRNSRRNSLDKSPPVEKSNPAPAIIRRKSIHAENSNTAKHPVEEKLIIQEQTESNISDSEILSSVTQQSNKRSNATGTDHEILEIDRQKLQSMMDKVKEDVLNQYDIHTGRSENDNKSRKDTIMTSTVDSLDKPKTKNIFETKYKMTKEEIQDFQNFYALLWYYYYYDIERYKVLWKEYEKGMAGLVLEQIGMDPDLVEFQVMKSSPGLNQRRKGGIGVSPGYGDFTERIINANAAMPDKRAAFARQGTGEDSYAGRQSNMRGVGG